VLSNLTIAPGIAQKERFRWSFAAAKMRGLKLSAYFGSSATS
jgi:hypothetical protein